VFWHDGRVRPFVAWSLTLPALLVTEHAGHVLVHRIEERDAHAREQLLAQTGHGYMSSLEAFVGLCVVLVAAGLAGRVVAGFRNRPLRRLPTWWCAGLPAVAFLLQEEVGRFLQTGGVERATAFEPVLAFGALLQVAGGLLCVLLVRKLLLAAHSAGRALARSSARRARLAAIAVELRCPQFEQPRLLTLAHGAGERAPPVFG
jgi:hypothetical protein